MAQPGLLSLLVSPAQRFNRLEVLGNEREERSLPVATRMVDCYCCNMYREANQSEKKAYMSPVSKEEACKKSG